MTDFGLYGPGSVTWKVHDEPILFVAGLRALILQSLHPRAIAGVAQNSDYKSRPAHRLEQTSDYVITMIYGTTPEAQRAAARVRGIHSRMRAHDLFTGEEFRLDEPELLRWVHVTEVESFLTVARRAGVRLTDAEADRYFDEQRRGAALLGLDPETVPGSVAEVERYYADMQPRLAMTKEAADTLFFLTWPPMPFKLGWTPVRAAYLGVASLAIGLLPAWARRFYGLPGIEAADPAASLSARMLRLSLLAFPWALVRTPMYKAAMKRVEDAGLKI
ncbi:hypothetical protein Val02_53880 [Virgisporangium aliadipatigenens]|uniref:ER-bound oxygenase mpaB/mpaB'/Rubber oxygenase catalytic domain-containing protein n=1 Tax=Virgisporangium aliadipatigenens TaxID=741659 RepID=A0A8J3YQA7_9ACTN|nr:oxygenase MpaB family protein [Virgisporangium aliadipatigenens]GIJ48502.1 hypothetical protein Val02_53880 [Virgisporangium aliadipatigenens]